LGWQLYCHPCFGGDSEGWQYNCHPNMDFFNGLRRPFSSIHPQNPEFASLDHHERNPLQILALRSTTNDAPPAYFDNSTSATSYAAMPYDEKTDLCTSTYDRGFATISQLIAKSRLTATVFFDLRCGGPESQ
jgi:hypothetical protein